MVDPEQLRAISDALLYVAHLYSPRAVHKARGRQYVEDTVSELIAVGYRPVPADGVTVLRVGQRVRIEHGDQVWHAVVRAGADARSAPRIEFRYQRDV